MSNEELTVIARLRELFYRVLADEQFFKVTRENLDSAKQLLDLRLDQLYLAALSQTDAFFHQSPDLLTTPPAAGRGRNCA